jgi:hypothetical protein
MADRKTYETQFLLGAKIQSTLGAAFGQVQKNLKGARTQADACQRSMNKMSGAFKGAVGAAAAFFSFDAIVNYSNKASEAAQGQIANETKLTTIMKQRAKASDSQIQSILQLTEAQKQLGIIDDDAQIAGAQQLGTFVTRTKTLQILIPAMNNLLAQQKGVNATDQDAVNIGNMMGKVFTGQVGGLTRVGISFSKAQERVLKYGNEEQKAAMLAQVINENVGQMNAALAKTDQGKLAKANMELGDIQKKVGFKIIPLQVKMAEAFLKMSPAIDKIIPLLDKIPPIVDKIANAVTFVIKNWDKIGPVVKTVIVSILACKAAMIGLTMAAKAQMIVKSISTAWLGLQIAMDMVRKGETVLTAVQWLLNAAMTANPIGVVVVAVAALAAGAYLLIKNWNKVKTFFSNLWNWLKKNGSTILETVFMPWIGIPKLIIKNWDKIKGIFGGGDSKGKATVKRIKHHATGTSYSAGGPAFIGENGPELVNLPRGSQVFSRSRTESLLNNMPSGRGTSISYAPQIIIQGNADESVMKTALDRSHDDFERRYKALMNQRKRLSFAGG